MTDSSLESLQRSLAYHVSARGRSAATETHYCLALRRFWAWMEQAGIESLADVTEAHVEHYLSDLRATGIRPATLRYQFSGLQAVYKWHSAREGYLNPMGHMTAPRVPESQKDVVELDDLKRVVDTLMRRRRYRDAALVSGLAENGMRISEALKLTWQDVDWRNKVVHIHDTKNGDTRRVPMTAGFAEKLDLLQGKAKPEKWEAIFCSEKGKTLTSSGAQQMVRKAFLEAGVPGISPHDLRHTMATRFMDANPHGHHILKAIGGWKSDSMVRRYSRKGEEARAVEAFRQSTPIQL